MVDDEALVPGLPLPLSCPLLAGVGESFLRGMSAPPREWALSFCPRALSSDAMFISGLARFAGREASSQSDPRFLAPGEGLGPRTGGGFGGNELGLV